MSFCPLVPNREERRVCWTIASTSDDNNSESRSDRRILMDLVKMLLALALIPCRNSVTRRTAKNKNVFCCQGWEYRYMLSVVLAVVLLLLVVRVFLWASNDAPATIASSITTSAKKPPLSNLSSSFLQHIKATTTDIENSNRDPYIPKSMPIKTLLILIGNLRCGEKAWESLSRNFLDWNNNNKNSSSTLLPHRVDLALAIGDPSRSIYPNASLLSRSKYLFTFPEYGDDWTEALNLIDPNWTTRVAPLLSKSSIALGGVRYSNWHGSGAISFWIRWFLSQKLVEHNLVSSYDRFVITRPDHFYLCSHDLSALNPRYLWVPFGQDFGGITDRHLVVSSEHVLAALDILPGLFQDPSAYPRLSDDLYNPEQLLLDRWKQLGIAHLVRRFPRMMFTCGNAAIDDVTRWKATGDIVEEGVRKKYRKEYMQSVDTCQKN